MFNSYWCITTIITLQLSNISLAVKRNLAACGCRSGLSGFISDAPLTSAASLTLPISLLPPDLPAVFSSNSIFNTFPLLAVARHAPRTSACTTCLHKELVCFSQALATMVEVDRRPCVTHSSNLNENLVLFWWVISTLTLHLVQQSLAFTCRRATRDTALWWGNNMPGLYLRGEHSRLHISP